MDPCKTCADHFCCRSMCRNKKNYLDYIEGEVENYKVKPISNKRVVITTNKNGIRREEYR